MCPSVKTRKGFPRQIMGKSVLNTLLSELEAINYRGTIAPYFMSEPFLIKNYEERFIRTIRERLPRSIINIHTNGVLLTAERIIQSFDYGLNHLQINIYNDKDYKYAMSIVLSLPKNIHLISTLVHATKGVKGKNIYIADWRNATPRGGWNNRAGNVSLSTKKKLPLNSSCVMPFRHVNIDVDGNFILCCNDWYKLMSSRNIMRGGLDCWFTDKTFNLIRNSLINKDRFIPLCRNCDYSGGGYKHLLKLDNFQEIKEYKDRKKYLFALYNRNKTKINATLL